METIEEPERKYIFHRLLNFFDFVFELLNIVNVTSAGNSI